MPNRIRWMVGVACAVVVALVSLSTSAHANQCLASFITDIGPEMRPPNGEVQTVSHNCFGNSRCSDYFDIVLAQGDQITVGFCDGGFAGFAPDLAIFQGTSLRSCNTNFHCSAGPLTTFVAPSSGTFRVRIGHRFGNGGPYNLIYTVPATSEIIGAIPACFAVDAIDDQFTVINDGTATSFDVLDNEECDGDTPVRIVSLPGDLNPDRGGVASTHTSEVVYTPAAGFLGFEEFTYTAEDAGTQGTPQAVDQDTARVIVNVTENLVPIAVDDFAETEQREPVIVPVLTNDSLGNAPVTVAVLSQADEGFASVQPNRTIRYTPNAGFYGLDRFSYRLTDSNGDVDTGIVEVSVFFTDGTVPIDIKPNDPDNGINLNAGQGHGISIAILSDPPYFDAPAQIDPLTLKFGPRGANIQGAPRFQDLDGDGGDDLIVKFLVQQTGIACGDTAAFLTGRTFDARTINASDAVNTSNCPRVRKRH